jgi:hypothetical protein
MKPFASDKNHRGEITIAAFGETIARRVLILLRAIPTGAKK